jgi:hypothetical protein
LIKHDCNQAFRENKTREPSFWGRRSTASRAPENRKPTPLSGSGHEARTKRGRVEKEEKESVKQKVKAIRCNEIQIIKIDEESN